MTQEDSCHNQRMAPWAWCLLNVVVLIGGCASQNFHVLAAERANSFESSQRVVEVTVRSVDTIERVDLVFGENRERIVVVDVDRVLNGPASPSVLHLRNLRDLTPSERAMFPYKTGIIPGVRLRLLYDPAMGMQLANLKIIPLGLTEDIEHAIATSHPTTKAMTDIEVAPSSAPAQSGQPNPNARKGLKEE
jgi:hypothetical protein